MTKAMCVVLEAKAVRPSRIGGRDVFEGARLHHPIRGERRRHLGDGDPLRLHPRRHQDDPDVESLLDDDTIDTSSLLTRRRTWIARDAFEKVSKRLDVF